MHAHGDNRQWCIHRHTVLKQWVWSFVYFFFSCFVTIMIIFRVCVWVCFSLFLVHFHCANCAWSSKRENTVIASIYLWQEDGNVWNFIWLQRSSRAMVCTVRIYLNTQPLFWISICALLDSMLFMFGLGWYFMRLLLLPFGYRGCNYTPHTKWWRQQSI